MKINMKYIYYTLLIDDYFSHSKQQLNADRYTTYNYINIVIQINVQSTVQSTFVVLLKMFNITLRFFSE